MTYSISNMLGTERKKERKKKERKRKKKERRKKKKERKKEKKEEEERKESKKERKKIFDKLKKFWTVTGWGLSKKKYYKQKNYIHELGCPKQLICLLN